jgi:hypothetical protein
MKRKYDSQPWQAAAAGSRGRQPRQAAMAGSYGSDHGRKLLQELQDTACGHARQAARAATTTRTYTACRQL